MADTGSIHAIRTAAIPVQPAIAIPEPERCRAGRERRLRQDHPARRTLGRLRPPRDRSPHRPDHPGRGDQARRRARTGHRPLGHGCRLRPDRRGAGRAGGDPDRRETRPRWCRHARRRLPAPAEGQRTGGIRGTGRCRSSGRWPTASRCSSATRRCRASPSSASESCTAPRRGSTTPWPPSGGRSCSAGKTTTGTAAPSEIHGIVTPQPIPIVIGLTGVRSLTSHTVGLVRAARAEASRQVRGDLLADRRTRAGRCRCTQPRRRRRARRADEREPRAARRAAGVESRSSRHSSESPGGRERSGPSSPAVEAAAQ